MKLLLLKILLQRRAKDEGYVLPMVIAIGLVMALLGAVNLTSAKEESFNAITQNSRSDALGIAEVGVARYREMLDRNRILTVYNRNRWTSNNVNGVDVAGQTCEPITAVGNGWASNEAANTPFNAANWRAVTADEDVVGRDLNNDGDATDNGVNIGWYKIVDYEYDIDGALGGTDNDAAVDATDDDGNFSVVRDIDPTHPAVPNPSVDITTGDVINTDNDVDNDGESDARGILTVKGRTLDGSEAQIEVEIPIRINDLTSFAPVLWIGNGAITTPGTINVAAPDNVVMANVPASATGCPTNPPIAGITNFVNDPRDLPPIIEDPTVGGTGLPGSSMNERPGGITVDSGGETIFPEPQDIVAEATATTPIVLSRGDEFAEDDLSVSDDYYERVFGDDDRRYLYTTTTLTIDNTDLLTDGTSKVVLYTTDNIDIDGPAGGAGNTLIIGNEDAKANFVARTSNVSSHNLEIYGTTGTTQIDIDPNGGTINIEALIHAPQATLNISGSGTINVNGALWINDITNTGGATLNINGDTTDTTTGIEPSYKFYASSVNRTPRPLTSSPTNWKTEEVN